MNRKCYIIAEVGLNHNGSIEIAKELIDIAKQAGVDAVKFQKRTVELLTTKKLLEANDDRFPNFGKTYGEIRSHLEFNESEYKDLKKYTKEKNLDFIVTPFDIEAFNFLNKIEIDKYKLASHSLTNIDLIQYMSKYDIEIILSTGMAEVEEIDRAFSILKNKNLSLLHCVSSYPTPLNECNLQVISFLKERYKIPVGYSGHELGFLPSLAAVAIGAQIIERHITIDKKMEGFDHKLSLEPNELKDMVDQIRKIEDCFSLNEKKVSNKEMITRNKYHVSMISKRAIVSGELLNKDMIIYKNPGTGIPPKKENEYINKKVSVDIPIDTLITDEMFANE